MRLKHVHKVTSKSRTYYYAWRGGPRLQGEPGTPEFMASYQEAWDHKKNSIQNGTLDALVVRYRESADFRNLRPLTRRDMTKALDRVREEFGAMDLTAFEDIRMRQAILEWRDEWANNPRTADYMVGTLRRVLSFGKDRGLLGRNIAERIKPLYSVNRSHIIWTEAEIDKLCRIASPEIEAAVRLASLTGLRRGDLLKLPWNAISEKSIVWRTSKTNAPVFIPLLSEAQAILADLPRVGEIVLTSQRRKPWSPDGFSTTFQKVKSKAGIEKRFHDLRGTAVTRFLMAGLTIDEVAMVVGWSRKNVEQISKRYVHRAAIAESILQRISGTSTERAPRTEPEEKL